MDKFEFISQIVSTLLLAASAIYGIAVSFKKKSILFAQIIASGVACLALGNIFTLMLRITAPEEIKNSLTNGFNIGMLGVFGFFIFIFSAAFGQIDGLGDDRSKAMRKYRIIGILAVVPVIVSVVLIVLSPIGDTLKIVYAILYSPAALASYYNLKHLILPDVDLGIIACIRKYNLFMLITTGIILLSTVLKVYQLTALYGISVILLGIMGFVLIISAKRGAERWFS